MATVFLPQLGGCVCGALRYVLKAAPLLAYACHCHDCQKRTGSAFTLTLVIHAADLGVTGATKVVERRSRNDRSVLHSFCPECRVPVFSCAPLSLEFMSLRAGTLDDASWVVPISQTFVESAIPWAIIPSVPVVPWEGFDFAEQGKAWQESAPEFRQ